jgi:methionyl-tRNA formyltransferase
MKIVFFGTSRFSAEILAFLATLPHEILAVVTRPDRHQGRDLRLAFSPVKEWVLSHRPDIPLFQPEKASTEEFCEELKKFPADLFLVVAYGEILKTNILNLPSKACVNIHASLLPKYRGAAPIQRCIMDGEKTSGVTFMEMVLKMDAGDIIAQEEVSISDDMNALDLEKALLDASKKGLSELLLHFDSYYAKKQPQQESLVTFAAKITAEDSLVNWTQDARKIQNQIRGLSPSPGVYIRLQFGSQSKRLKILKSRVCKEKNSLSPGQVEVGRASLWIGTGLGSLELQEVQLEGKKAMSAEEFLRGAPKVLSLAD